MLLMIPTVFPYLKKEKKSHVIYTKAMKHRVLLNVTPFYSGLNQHYYIIVAYHKVATVPAPVVETGEATLKSEVSLFKVR